MRSHFARVRIGKTIYYFKILKASQLVSSLDIEARGRLIPYSGWIVTGTKPTNSLKHGQARASVRGTLDSVID